MRGGRSDCKPWKEARQEAAPPAGRLGLSRALTCAEAPGRHSISCTLAINDTSFGDGVLAPCRCRCLHAGHQRILAVSGCRPSPKRSQSMCGVPECTARRYKRRCSGDPRQCCQTKGFASPSTLTCSSEAPPGLQRFFAAWGEVQGQRKLRVAPALARAPGHLVRTFGKDKSKQISRCDGANVTSVDTLPTWPL